MLSDSRPKISTCSVGGLLLEATKYISDSVIEFTENEVLDRCNLFVAHNPNQATLESAFSTLKPGGNLYAEWTVSRCFKTKTIKERLSRIGFNGIFLYLPKPDPSRSIPTIWIPLEVPGAIEFLVETGYARSSGLKVAARIGYEFRRILWRLIPRLFLSFPWLLSSGSEQFSVCSICSKPGPNITDSRVTATSLTFLEDYVLTEDLNQTQELSALMLADSMDRANKVILLVYQGRNYTPSFVVKASRTHESAYLLDNESTVLQSIDEKYKNIDGVPKILYANRDNDINVNIQTVIGGAQLSSILNRSNYQGYAELITDWLVNLAMNTKTLLPQDWRTRMVSSLLSDLDSLFGKIVSPDFIHNTNSALVALEIPSLVCEHRDLGPQNIYIDSDSHPGVIDWEYSRLSGIPALDLIFFLTRASMIIHGAPKTITISESYRQMIDCNTFTGTIFYNCLNSYMDRLDIPRSQLPALRLMTWIVHYSWRMFYDKLSWEEPLNEEALNHWSFTLWTEELSIS